GEHASGVVAAERDHSESVPGAEFLVHLLGESLAAREAGWALGHGGAGAIESAQRQDVDFAKQVGHGTRRELLLQLVVGLPGGVSAGAMFQPIGPLVVGGAVAAVGEGAETRGLGVRTRVVEVRVA